MFGKTLLSIVRPVRRIPEGLVYAGGIERGRHDPGRQSPLPGDGRGLRDQRTATWTY